MLLNKKEEEVSTEPFESAFVKYCSCIFIHKRLVEYLMLGSLLWGRVEEKEEGNRRKEKQLVLGHPVGGRIASKHPVGI